MHRPDTPPQVADLSQTLDTLILHLAAFAGMQGENMTRGQGWRFLEIGRRLERSLGTFSLLRVAAESGDEESVILDPLLEVCDSVMTYRRRHFSKPRWEPVCDLLFSDGTNPRSVAFQIFILKREAAFLPGDPGFGLLPKIREHMATLDSPFDKEGAQTPEDLELFGESLEELSDLLTQHYFSHSVRRVY